MWIVHVTMTSVLLAAIVILSQTGPAHAYECLTYQVWQCVLDKGHNISTHMPIFTFSEEMLRDFCAIDYHFIQACMEDIAVLSDTKVRAQLQGCADSLSYICQEDLEDYIHVKDCVNSNVSQSEISLCGHQYHREKDFFDDCQNFAEFIDCEGDAVTVLCGHVAGQWTRTYNSKLYQPSLDLLQCGGQTRAPVDDSGGLPLWLILVIGVGSAVFVCVVVLVVCFGCRKTISERTGAQQTQDVETGQATVNLQQMGTGAVNGWHMPSNTTGVYPGQSYPVSSLQYDRQSSLSSQTSGVTSQSWGHSSVTSIKHSGEVGWQETPRYTHSPPPSYKTDVNTTVSSKPPSYRSDSPGDYTSLQPT